MLEARQAFLSTGHFDPIAASIATVLPSASTGRLVDVGCGTGFYLERTLRERPGWAGLAVDASPGAVAMATRFAGCPGVVLDSWQPVPIRDAVASAVLCVFAPRNPAEFRRILEPGATLVTVTPRDQHLRELRETGDLLGIQPHKREQLDGALLPHFRLEDRRELEYSVALTAAEADLVIGMGPSAHHGERTRAVGGQTATISVDVSVFLAA